MDNNLMANILSEFEKSQEATTSEIVRVQDDLSNCESELVALQIRFVHRNKENEDLKRQLEAKNKLLAERHSSIECNNERFIKLEFHYNELMQKHKLCLDCMGRQKIDYDTLAKDYDQSSAKVKLLEEQKSTERDLLTDQIDVLKMKLEKIGSENEANIRTIKDLRISLSSKELEVVKLVEQRELLQCSSKLLREEMDMLKQQYHRNFATRSTTITSYEETVKKLELELAKVTSKLDKSHFEASELYRKNNEQLKIIEQLNEASHQKDLKYNEFMANFETCFLENISLEKLNSGLMSEVSTTTRLSETEREQFKRQQTVFEGIVKNLTLLYNEQQKKFESIVLCAKAQNSTIKNLRKNTNEFRKKLEEVKKGYYLLKSRNYEFETENKVLHDRCFELDEKLREMERDLYVTRDNLDSTVNELSNLQNLIGVKEVEVAEKCEVIEKLQSLIGRQNCEFNKRKIEIDERMRHIDELEESLRLEKIALDQKLITLESNLKSKSKQLNQRNEEIRDMNDLVEALKEEKEREIYKSQQIENLFKCQQVEIESKSSIIRQFELRNEDMMNELGTLKDVIERLRVTSRVYERADKGAQCVDETVDRITQTESDELESASSYTISTDSQTLEMSSAESFNDRLLIDDLRMNLKIKETIIETVNDNLVLKEAEIARLKSRIGVYERKKKSNGLC